MKEAEPGSVDRLSPEIWHLVFSYLPEDPWTFGTLAQVSRDFRAVADSHL
jgi:hypothetical protein